MCDSFETAPAPTGTTRTSIAVETTKDRIHKAYATLAKDGTVHRELDETFFSRICRRY